MARLPDPALLKPFIASLFNDEKMPWSQWQGTVDDTLIELLIQHAMVPLVHNLAHQTGCLADWPDDLKEKLADIARQEAAIELARKNDIQRVLAQLDTHAIHPLLLKGTPLSYLLYPAPVLRPRSDTDLLIRVEDKDRVAELFKDAGYQPYFEINTNYLSTQTAYTRKDTMQITHAYDVHWKISNINAAFSNALTYEKLIDRSQTVPKLGKNSRTIGPAESLLLACFHRAVNYAHSGEYLIALYDIHLLVNYLDENEFRLACDYAEQFKILTIFKDAILNAQHWFNTVLPAWVKAFLSETTQPDASADYLQTEKVSGIKKHAMIELRTLKSWQDRTHYILEKIFPPKAYMFWRYNTRNIYLLPFLYGYRLIYGIYIFARK